jgi:hypothetical protein
MHGKKQRVEIAPITAAETLFLSDRTCCVCRKQGKPIQIHHIDEDSSNSVSENLAVLCFDCHRETQIHGGFDRKLDALQIRLYREDWVKRVEGRRREEHGPIRPEPTSGDRLLRYLQIKDKSDEYLYSFEADFTLVGSEDRASDSEVNACINAFITERMQRFRADAIARAPEKRQMQGAVVWDSLAISHTVSLFSSRLLSLEFHFSTCFAGSVHPNSNTETLNFRLRPSMRLSLHDIFNSSGDYLAVLSDYCVKDLYDQQPARDHDPVERAAHLRSSGDQWILTGAGPRTQNFEHLSFNRTGIVVHFDPYQVDCYAAGKYEVQIPFYKLVSILREGIADLLTEK